MSKLDDILKGAEYGFGQMAINGGGEAVPGVYKRAIKKLVLDLIKDVEKNRDKNSMAHDLYGGGKDRATGFRTGYNMSLNFLKKDIEEL